jgi:membrane protein required for colicin V production
MNYFDLIIAVVLVWAFYSGYKKGIIYMLISFLAIVIGIYAAIHFSYLIVDKLGEWINKDADQLKILSYVLTFVIVFAILHLVGKILDKFLEAVALGFVNRIAGGALSVAIKIVVLSLALWLFDQANQIFPIVKQDTLNNSILYKPLKNLSPVILVNLEKLKNNKTLQKIKEKELQINQNTDTETNSDE